MVASVRLRKDASALALLLVAVAVRGGPAQAASLTLEDCIREAIGRAPAVHAAAFDTAAAAGHLQAARAAYMPELSAHGEYGRAEGFDETVTDGGSTAAVVSLDATLLDGGFRDAQLAAARARIQSAGARERQRHADVAQEVRVAYFTALAARAEVEIQEDGIRNLLDAVSSLRRQAALGLVSQSDVLRAQLAAETAQVASRSAASELAASLRDIELLTGFGATAEVLIDATDPWAPLQVTDEAIDMTPIVADARSAADAAASEADAARSEYWPRLTLSASGGALGVGPGTTFREHGGGQFLVGVTVPLFDGGARDGRIAALVAAAASAHAQEQEARRAVTTAIARARIVAAQARADATTWQRAVAHASENLTLTRAGYFGGGNVRLLEVLDALTQLVETRLNVVRAELVYRLTTASQLELLGEVGG